MSRSVLIVEDEPLIADDLYFHLQDLGIENIEIALRYEDALKKLSEGKFDLALLDVNLSGDKDGVDVANFINGSVRIPFIFITSYYDSETLERVKKTQPSAYILKPFDKQDIQINVELVIHKSTQSPQLSNEKFFIKSKGKMISIDPESIDYVEAFDNYSKVWVDGQSHILSHTLKSVEDKLLDHNFVRVHKSYVVNFSRISMISEGYVFFGEEKVPIGRAFKNDFMSKISLL